MSLGSWLDRIQAQRTGFDDKYVSARAARIAQALAADEEERVARRAERAEAARLRQQQAEDLKRLRQRQQFEDALKLARGQVTFSGGMAQLPSDLGLGDEMLAGVDDPEKFRDSVSRLAISDYLASRQAAEEERRLKAAAEGERQKREIEAEGRALENAKRLAQFRAALEPERSERPESASPMAYQQAFDDARQLLTRQVGFNTVQPSEEEVHELALRILKRADEDRRRRFGARPTPGSASPPSEFPYNLSPDDPGGYFE